MTHFSSSFLDGQVELLLLLLEPANDKKINTQLQTCRGKMLIWVLLTHEGRMERETDRWKE